MWKSHDLQKDDPAESVDVDEFVAVQEHIAKINERRGARIDLERFDEAWADVGLMRRRILVNTRVVLEFPIAGSVIGDGGVVEKQLLDGEGGVGEAHVVDQA